MSSSEIVLYQYGGQGALSSLSPPCMKIDMALRRLGVPHRVVTIGALQVRRHSPSGRVPAVEMDGRVVVESCAILDALERRHPDADLWPGDRAQHAVDRLWDHFVTDTLYWSGAVQRYLVPENRPAAWDLFFGKGFSLRRLLMGPLIVREMRRRARAQGTALRPASDVRDAYGGGLAMIDEALAGHRFLQGRDVPGRGDLAVASHVAQLVVAKEMPGIGALLARFPRLQPHAARVFEACRMTPLPS
jgi:glutathione S-transferase